MNPARPDRPPWEPSHVVCDSAATVSRERTPEGFLRVRARIGRVGLHDYKARELGGRPVPRPTRPYGCSARPRTCSMPPAWPPSRASRSRRPPAGDDRQRQLEALRGRPRRHRGDPPGRPSGDRPAHHRCGGRRPGRGRGANCPTAIWADFVFTPGHDAAGRGLRRRAAQHPRQSRRPRRRGPMRPSPAGWTARRMQPAPARPRPARASRSTAWRSRPLRRAPPPRAPAGGLEAERRQRRAVAVKDGEIAALKAAAPDAATLDALWRSASQVIDAARATPRAGLRPLRPEHGRHPPRRRREASGHRAIRDRGDAYVAAAFDTLGAARRPHANPLAAHLGGRATDRAAARDARSPPATATSPRPGRAMPPSPTEPADARRPDRLSHHRGAGYPGMIANGEWVTNIISRIVDPAARPPIASAIPCCRALPSSWSSRPTAARAFFGVSPSGTPRCRPAPATNIRRPPQWGS